MHYATNYAFYVALDLGQNKRSAENNGAADVLPMSSSMIITETDACDASAQGQ